MPCRWDRSSRVSLLCSHAHVVHGARSTTDRVRSRQVTPYLAHQAFALPLHLMKVLQLGFDEQQSQWAVAVLMMVLMGRRPRCG